MSSPKAGERRAKSHFCLYSSRKAACPPRPQRWMYTQPSYVPLSPAEILHNVFNWILHFYHWKIEIEYGRALISSHHWLWPSNINLTRQLLQPQTDPTRWCPRVPHTFAPRQLKFYPHGSMANTACAGFCPGHWINWTLIMCHVNMTFSPTLPQPRGNYISRLLLNLVIELFSTSSKNLFKK